MVSILAIAFQLRFGLAIGKVQANQEGSMLNGKNHIFIYANDVDLSMSL